MELRAGGGTVWTMAAVASPSDASSRPGGGAGALRLVVVGGVLGVPAALLAAVFLAIVHEIEHWLWTDLPHDLGTRTPPVLGPVCDAPEFRASNASLDRNARSSVRRVAYSAAFVDLGESAASSVQFCGW